MRVDQLHPVRRESGQYVWVDRVDCSTPPRIDSMRRLAAWPLSSSENWTPMPCALLPWQFAGVIETTLPRYRQLLGSSMSVSSMNTSSPSGTAASSG